MRNYIVAAIAAVGLAGSAQAAQIAAGTASYAFLLVPSVTTGASSGSATIAGSIFTTSATGGFASAMSSFGTVAGTVNFSNTAGVTVNQSIGNFLSFGAFTFSVSSVATIGYTQTVGQSGIDTAISLYLLGDADSAADDATPSSVTLQLNSTGGSAYSVAASLANPPSSPPPPPPPSVPEPASWAMMLAGFGAMGATMRRRRTSVSFG